MLYVTTLALQNGYTKRCSQTGKPWYEHNESLNISVPPLDALIIPKACHECKTIHDLFGDHPDVFLFVTLYHSYASLCYNKFMNMQNTMEVVAALRARLEPMERAEVLSDVLEGQRPHARRAAVLVSLFEHNGETYLAFIRRANTLRSHSGEIAFPGGGIDPTDSSPVMAALREAQEEIGLDPARVEVVGILPPIFTVVSNYLITPVVAFLPRGLGTLQLQASEVTEVILVPLQGLADPTIAHTEEWTRGGVTRTVYFYDYGPYRIWGATARMLYALLEMLRPL